MGLEYDKELGWQMGMDQVVNIEVDKDNPENDIELCYWRKNYVLHSWMINNICIMSWFKNGREKETYDLENDEKLYLDKEDIDKMFASLVSGEFQEMCYNHFTFFTDEFAEMHFDFIKAAYSALNDGKKLYYLASW